MQENNSPGKGPNGHQQIINRDDDITNTQEQQEIDEGLREGEDAGRKQDKPEIEQPLNEPAKTEKKIPSMKGEKKDDELAKD